jgi:hypothetical protein
MRPSPVAMATRGATYSRYCVEQGSLPEGLALLKETVFCFNNTGHYLEALIRLDALKRRTHLRLITRESALLIAKPANKRPLER